MMSNEQKKRHDTRHTQTPQKIQHLQRCSRFYASDRKDQNIESVTRCAEGTYVRVPLEVLVDEPEGSDDGYDGKETRYDPPYIMRCNDPTETHNQSTGSSRETRGG